MEETTLVDYNARLRKGGKRLVAIYPKEGTFFSDDPLIVLDAPWVTAGQKAGAAKLVDYLSSPRGAVEGDGAPASARPTHSIPLARQPDGGERRRRERADAPPVLPEPKVLARVRELWHEDRKPADIVLVRRHVRLDGRRGQAGAGAGGARRGS